MSSSFLGGWCDAKLNFQIMDQGGGGDSGKGAGEGGKHALEFICTIVPRDGNISCSFTFEFVV